MPFEDPDLLLIKKLGREEYCQRMLTSLILEQFYPKWNTPHCPSEKGLDFLNKLHEKAFKVFLGESIQFIDEFDLPALHFNETGGAPDYAVLSPNTLWLIELKTEKGSHRKEQLPLYVRLAKHHYPEHTLELLYLTGEMERQEDIAGANVAFRHLFWSEIIELINKTWSKQLSSNEQHLVSALQREISNLYVPANLFREESRVIRDALKFAEVVQQTGKQAGINIFPGGLQELYLLRLRIRDALARQDKHKQIQPWIWNARTSGGSALTAFGKEVGYELRLSRYN